MKLESENNTPSTWKISIISPLDFLSPLEEFFYDQPYDNFPSITTFEIKGDKKNMLMDVYINEQPDQNRLAIGVKNLAGIYKTAEPKIHIEQLEDIDWVSQSQKILKPIDAGRFYLFGSHDIDTVPENKVPILMDAGQAFGTGSHETTKGCLLAIDDLYGRFDPDIALDLGCGSGVLAIAIAKQWASKVIASDIDPIATETATDNFRINGVEEIPIVTCDGFKDDQLASTGPYDLIVANILAKPLKLLAPDIILNLKQGGRLILSGLLKEQQEDIIYIYELGGMELEKRFPINEWQTLLLKKS